MFTAKYRQAFAHWLLSPLTGRISLLGLSWLMVGGFSSLYAADKEAVAPLFERVTFFDDGWAVDSSWYHGGWPDPGSSEGKTGQKEKDSPFSFLIPPSRQWADVDLATLSEAEGKSTTPYALIQLPRPSIIGGRMVPAGYYQIRLGLLGSGSQKISLPPAQATANTQARKLFQPRVAVFIQLGVVKAVAPVGLVRPWVATVGEPKPPKGPVALLQNQNTQPLVVVKVPLPVTANNNPVRRWVAPASAPPPAQVVEIPLQWAGGV